jgi:serine/threonine-protein kinase
VERSDAHDARCPRCGAPKGPGHACGPGKPRPGGAAPIGYGATLAIGSAGADPAPADPRVGQTLGKNYRIVAPIGAGGMGVVYEVEHLALKKRFAAKLLSQELSRHPEAIRRFELEAQAASRLEHDNIINVIDYGCGDDGTLYLIMELLRGETLRARVERGRPSSDEILGIVAQVCQALGHAHAAGIVHRDMKPDNVFLARRTSAYPVVKVLDFGIS